MTAIIIESQPGSVIIQSLTANRNRSGQIAGEVAKSQVVNPSTVRMAPRAPVLSSSNVALYSSSQPNAANDQAVALPIHSSFKQTPCQYAVLGMATDAGVPVSENAPWADGLHLPKLKFRARMQESLIRAVDWVSKRQRI